MTSLVAIMTALIPPQQTDTPVVVTVSGELKVDYLVRGGTLNEASHWIIGGLPAGSPFNDGDTGTVGKFSLDLSLRMGEDWDARILLANQRVNFDTFTVPEQTKFLAKEPTDLLVEKAWLRRSWSLVPGIEETLGVQNFAPQPAGSPSIFLDLGHAESPWGELPDSTAPPFPTSGTNTLPQTRRDELQPVGAVFAGYYAQLDWALFLFPAVVEGGKPSDDEAVYGFHVSVPVGKTGSRVEGIATAFAGDATEQLLYTGGIGGMVIVGPLEAGAEGYVQFGEAGTDLDAKGRALRARAQVSFGDLALEAGYVYLSGDEDGLDDEESRFFSYENNDEFLILESNEFGLDLDNNLRSWRVAVEGPVLDVGAAGALEAGLRIGGFRFDREVPLPPDPVLGTPAREDSLGIETNLTLRLPLSGAVSLDASFAFLFGAKALEIFTRREEDSTLAGTVGFRARF